ncbi:MAG: 4'-phosphopantetheinyl transferase family protein [Bacillus sp. (in: firmicutes)]
MTRIYTCSIHPLEKGLFNELLLHVDDQVKERIQRYKRKEDKVRTLLAHTLSKMMLAKELHINPHQLQYRVNKYGKYELITYPLSFNMSHAHHFVVCAVSDKPVGIDIEKQQQRDFQLFTTVWSETERRQYDLCDQQSFYRLWTAKESYVKYLGVGLNASLAEISVRKDGSIVDQQRRSAAHIEYVNVHEEYMCAVCSEERIESVEEISIKQIESFYRRDEYGENY